MFLKLVGMSGALYQLVVFEPGFHSKNWDEHFVFLISPSNKIRGKAFAVPSKKNVLDDEKNLMKSRQRGEGSNSSCAVNNRSVVWHKLWKLSCQPRVCHFLWRLARNSLAFKMNIQRRGVQLDTRCLVCHGWMRMEDILS